VLLSFPVSNSRFNRNIVYDYEMNENIKLSSMLSLAVVETSIREMPLVSHLGSATAIVVSR
jgi:hypothetical protein